MAVKIAQCSNSTKIQGKRNQRSIIDNTNWKKT